MQQKIEQLSALFKKRDEIDQQIVAVLEGKETLAFFGIPVELTGTPPVVVKKQKRKWTRRVKPDTQEDIEKNPVVKKYHCKDCGETFNSSQKYLDVCCSFCKSARALKMPG